MKTSHMASKLSHHYNAGGYFKPTTLWTPEEIEENGFYFLPCHNFLQDLNDLENQQKMVCSETIEITLLRKIFHLI